MLLRLYGFGNIGVFTGNFFQKHPQVSIILGYIVYIAIGALLLSLPFSTTHSISFLDNLFISTSAVSTTGLATVDPGTSYTFFGQLVLLSLIQFGGIGYMTFSSFVLLIIGKGISETRHSVTKVILSLPEGFSMRDFIKRLIVFTLVCEFIGTIILYMVFSLHNEKNALWSALFHSVSAFSTAGFSLYSDGLMKYKTNVAVNLTIDALSLLGGIGFIVMSDIYSRIFGKCKQLTFTTKVILATTAILVAGSTLIIAITDPVLKHTGLLSSLQIAFFQVVSASSTAGFNSVDIAHLAVPTLILLSVLMIIGASPTGTGGGIKSTAIAILFAIVISTLRGKSKVELFGHTIKDKRISIATASAAFYIVVLLIGVFLLTMSENVPQQQRDLLETTFEAASALSTVGLSMGLTGSLTFSGKIIIIALMFIGRLGVLTFGMAFLKDYRFFPNNKDKKPKNSDIVV